MEICPFLASKSNCCILSFLPKIVLILDPATGMSDIDTEITRSFFAARGSVCQPGLPY